MHKIFLFYGEDDFALDNYEKRFIKKYVDEQWESFNVNIINSEEFGLDKVIESVNSPPFGFGNKVTIVKNSEFLFSKKSEYIDDFKNLINKGLLETNYLLFFAQKIDKRKELVKLLIKSASVKELSPPKPWELVKKLKPWTEDMVRLYGKRIEQKAVSELIESTGFNKQRLKNEIEKLVLYVGTEKVITYENVRKMVVNTESDLFELLELLAKQQKDIALQQINKILLKENPIKFIASLSSNLLNTYQMKSFQEEKYTNQEIGKEVGRPPFIVEKNLKVWRNFSSQKLRKALKDLFDLEIRFKSMSVNHNFEIEKFIIGNF